MKFKESKSLIEEGIEREGTILVSMNGEIYLSLIKKSGGEMEIIQNTFDVFWGDSVYNQDGNQGDDYLYINDKSWKSFLSLIG